MQKIKDFGKSRAAGFYVTAGAALLSLISAILYAVNFSAEPEMSWTVFTLPLAAFLAAAALLCAAFFFPKFEKRIAPFAPAVLAVLSLVTLCLFILRGYDMISRLVVGHAEKIENIFTFFGIGLPVGLIFFLITAALSTAAVFLKQRKEEPAKESAQEESIKELKEENGEEAEAREVEAYEVEVEKIN